MERTNETGTIRIHENVLGRVVLHALQKSEGRAFAASEKGKLLSGLSGRPTAGEVGDNLSVREEGDVLHLTCHVILSFGAGVKRTTDKILDDMEQELKVLFPGQGGLITLRVVGVRSKQVAERDIEVERRWN